MVDETHKKFVEHMVESSKKKFEEPEPNNPTDADPEEIEDITKEIRRKIQQNKE